MSEEEVVFSDDMTLGEARLLFNMLLQAGCVCPTCERPAKIYRRNINATQVKGLLCLYKEAGREWGDLQAARRRAGNVDSREEHKLVYWGLIEINTDARDGTWRVTALGEAFLRNEVTLPKYAFVYDGACIGHDGDEIGIFDILTEDEYKEILL